MRTTARKRTTKPRTRQKSLFEKSDEPKLLRAWRQPKIDRQADPRWIFAWVDPQQLGVEVVIPEWMTRLGRAGA
jgi:hypothetical protein